MPTLRRLFVIVGLSLASLLALVLPSAGAPRAWLLHEDGRAIKVDLQTKLIIDRTLVGGPTRVQDLAADPARGYLFVPYGRRGPLTVDVHDLKSLRRKAQLGLLVEEAPTDDNETIRFIFPPTGSALFARIWNPDADGGAGAFEVVTIDATTWLAGARRSVTPALEAKLMVAPGGSQVYSLRSDAPAKVDTFDLPSLTWQKSLNLESFISPQAYGRDIDDFGEGKILVVENEKRQRDDPNSYTLFVLDLLTGSLSPKIRTGREGQGILLPKSNRVAFDEKKGAFHPVTRVPYPAGTGGIQIFDAVTGNPLGTINIPGVKDGEVLGVSPAEDLLYYQSYESLRTNPQLWIISLRTFSVMGQIPLPFAASRMFLFDE